MCVILVSVAIPAVLGLDLRLRDRITALCTGGLFDKKGTSLL